MNLRLFAVALLLGGCVSTSRTTVTYEDEQVPLTQVAAGLQDTAIASALDRVLSAGTENLNRLPTVGAGLADNFVHAESARGAVMQFQLTALHEFGGPQYEGIRPELIETLTSDRWAKRLAVEQSPLVGPIVSTSSVSDVFEQILGVVRGLTKRPDKRVTFRVETEPKEATFRICPQYLNEQCFELTTDGEVASILRGYYTYDIALTGYKPVKINLDLVPFAKTRLRCILRREDDPRDAGPCTPE